MRPGAAPLAYPYETNLEKSYDDRSSYTPSMFMRDRGFTAHERGLARNVARLCVRIREHQAKYRGQRKEWEGDTPGKVLGRTNLSLSRQCQVMGAAVRIAKTWGVDFGHNPTEQSTPQTRKMLDALKELAQELGHTPTGRDMDDADTTPVAKTYRKYFGSIRRAQQLAGLDSNPPHNNRPMPTNTRNGDNQEAA